jgi:hypothetical protein
LIHLEIVKVLFAACSNNFKITFPADVGKSRDFISKEPLVIKVKLPFGSATIPFFLLALM